MSATARRVRARSRNRQARGTTVRWLAPSGRGGQRRRRRRPGAGIGGGSCSWRSTSTRSSSRLRLWGFPASRDRVLVWVVAGLRHRGRRAAARARPARGRLPAGDRVPLRLRPPPRRGRRRLRSRLRRSRSFASTSGCSAGPRRPSGSSGCSGRPGHPHVWDYFAFLVYLTYFIVPITVAAVLWRRAPQLFHRYVSLWIGLSFAALVTYALYPASPPWLASRHGLLPHVVRITPYMAPAHGCRPHAGHGIAAVREQGRRGAVAPRRDRAAHRPLLLVPHDAMALVAGAVSAGDGACRSCTSASTTCPTCCSAGCMPSSCSSSATGSTTGSRAVPAIAVILIRRVLRSAPTDGAGRRARRAPSPPAGSAGRRNCATGGTSVTGYLPYWRRSAVDVSKNSSGGCCSNESRNVSRAPGVASASRCGPLVRPAVLPVTKSVFTSAPPGARPDSQ